MHLPLLEQMVFSLGLECLYNRPDHNKKIKFRINNQIHKTNNMKNKNTILQFFALIFLAIIFILQTGCKKEENNDPVDGEAEFNVSLKSSTSSKSNYESVNIDIKKVSIHTSTDSTQTSGWFDLETNTGVYDLLDYDAGNDTIIALDPALQVVTVSQIRLILGNNNTVVESGETYDLDTPSAQTSGLKIQVHAQLLPNHAYKVVLDFDADKSIVKTGNGKYKLTPVIKATVVQL